MQGNQTDEYPGMHERVEQHTPHDAFGTHDALVEDNAMGVVVAKQIDQVQHCQQLGEGVHRLITRHRIAEVVIKPEK